MRGSKNGQTWVRGDVMSIRGNPFITRKARGRLWKNIQSLQTYDAFLTEFPSWIRGSDNYPEWDGERQWEYMAQFPWDTVDGILGRMCHACGVLVARPIHYGPDAFCRDCKDALDSLIYPDDGDWNGLTIAGCNAVRRGMGKGKGPPTRAEVIQWEYKVKPKRFVLRTADLQRRKK